MEDIKLSLVIPAKDKNDPKLQELLKSIEAQDFPREQMEVLIITEGTSESAKAIGIRKSRGEVIGILASDNVLIGTNFLREMYQWSVNIGACYPANYFYNFVGDDILNRYFALIGGNDPLAYYMGKNDRDTFLKSSVHKHGTSTGDNGFFVKRELIEQTDLDNYYHIDNSNEIDLSPKKLIGSWIWHKTGGNIFTFFKKRYHYGLQHAFNKNRRWHLVDFSQPQDIRRLLWFIFATLTVIQPLYLSIRGYLKVKDVAWFLHPVVCLMTLFTYGILILNLGIKQLSQSLFAPMEGLKA